jgi:hypothetical protein
MQGVARALAVANKLAGVDRDVSIVNGSALNMGSSFAQAAAAAGGGRGTTTNVNINAAGVYMNKEQLARMVREELLRVGRSNVSVGLA